MSSRDVVHVRLLPSLRYIPVKVFSEDDVSSLCARVARPGVSPLDLRLWVVAPGGARAPEKAAETTATLREPLPPATRLASARVFPGAWLLVEEAPDDAPRRGGSAGALLWRVAGALLSRCSGGGSTSSRAREEGGEEGGGGGGGKRASRGVGHVLCGLLVLGAFAALQALEWTGGVGGEVGVGGGRGGEGGVFFQLAPGALGGGGAAAGEPLLPTRALFSTFTDLSGGSEAIVKAVDRGGGGAAAGCYPLLPLTRPVQRLVGLPACLEVGERYSAVLVAEDVTGRPRCGGGDYFEVLLYGGGPLGSRGPAILKRPWLQDGGAGNYTLTLHVPAIDTLVGDYVLHIHPLFLQGEGFGTKGPLTVKASVARMHDKDDLTARLWFGARGSCSGGGGGAPAGSAPINGAPPSMSPRPSLPPPLPVCTRSKMAEPAWHGYWLRAPPHYAANPCEPPYCAAGSTTIQSVMDDNVDLWVYRREDCAFKLMHPRDARRCLDGKSVLGMGDSNMQDTFRNLMMHALQVDPDWFIPDGNLYLDRTFNFSLRFPGTVSPGYGELPEFSLQLGMIFTGHWNTRVKGGLGVRTYANDTWLAGVADWWRRLPAPPDHLVVNDAGLHTCQWTSGDPHGMAKAAALLRDHVVPWWLTNHKKAPGAKTPKLLFRSNVVPGHESRSLRANPQSLEALNAITAAELLRGLKGDGADIKSAALVDFYDITFPFHYYDFYGDGGHYGRPIYYLPPGRTKPYVSGKSKGCSDAQTKGPLTAATRHRNPPPATPSLPSADAFC
jgi:hypothetical protein